MSKVLAFEPLKLMLSDYSLNIPVLPNGAADLINAEVSAVITRTGKEIFPNSVDFEGCNVLLGSPNFLLPRSCNAGNFNKSFFEEDYVKTVFEAGPESIYYNTPGLTTSSTRFQGETYTLSFEVKCDNIFDLLWYPSNSYSLTNYITPTEGIWKKIIFTYTQTGEDRAGNVGGLFGFRAKLIGVIILYRNLKLERGSNSNPIWTPNLRELLINATIISHNCTAVAIGDKIKITTITPGTTEGWIDVTVNYANLSSTKRIRWALNAQVNNYKASDKLLTFRGGGGLKWPKYPKYHGRENLIVWYDFMGKKNTDPSRAIAEDLSGKGNNGTLYNFAFNEHSGYNDGLRFDGTPNSYVNFPLNPAIVLGSPRTIEILLELDSVYPDTAETYRILGARLYKHSNGHIYIDQNSRYVINRNFLTAKTKLLLTIRSTGNVLETFGYVNGVYALSSQGADNPVTEWNTSILGHNSSAALKGKIYSLRIYNKSLTDDEMQNNYLIDKSRFGLGTRLL